MIKSLNLAAVAAALFACSSQATAYVSVTLPRLTDQVLTKTSIAPRDTVPFTLTVQSSNTTLSGTHGYIQDDHLLFTSNPSIPPAVFTFDNLGGHWTTPSSSNPDIPIVWAVIDSSNSYDANIYFADPADPYAGRFVLCHQYTNYISCAVNSENMTRLSKLYVCPRTVFGTFSDVGLKIGNVVPAGCSAVQLNFTNVP